MNFVSDKVDIVDSRAWGNYEDSTDVAASGSGYSNMEYITGRNEAWKAKNIYDLAGNVAEWTMEYAWEHRRVVRGGCVSDYGAAAGAVDRSAYDVPFDIYDCVGFRPTLYIAIE